MYRLPKELRLDILSMITVIKIFGLPQSTNWTALVTAAKKDNNMVAQTSFIWLVCRMFFDKFPQRVQCS